MADNQYQTIASLLHQVRVGNLPPNVIAKNITDLFEAFGTVVRLFLKRRISKNSRVYLANPYVILIFAEPESVNEIMLARPLFLGDCELFIRRCLPMTPKYPDEPFRSVRKILIRTESDNDDQILPDDKSITAYISGIGGKIEYFERLNPKTVLVQFNDYDPVDVCCLSRPHVINNQPVEIEKCWDEEYVRSRIESQHKSHSVFDTLPSTSTFAEVDNQIMDSASPPPTLSIDDQIIHLRSSYNNVTTRLEHEHEQLVASLAAEWEQIARERIRLQRLTLDYQQEHERFSQDNRKWQKLFSDSLREKPLVQSEGEQKLKEACQKQTMVKEKYDQLLQNIQ